MSDVDGACPNGCAQECTSNQLTNIQSRSSGEQWLHAGVYSAIPQAPQGLPYAQATADGKLVIMTVRVKFHFPV
jgi:hypothetical protein